MILLQVSYWLPVNSKYVCKHLTHDTLSVTELATLNIFMYRLLTDWCCMCSPASADASMLSSPALLFQPTSTLQYNKLWMSADYFEDTWWFWLRSVWSHQEDLSSLGIIKDKKYAQFNSFSFFVLVRYLLRSKQQKAKLKVQQKQVISHPIYWWSSSVLLPPLYGTPQSTLKWT